MLHIIATLQASRIHIQSINADLHIVAFDVPAKDSTNVNQYQIRRDWSHDDKYILELFAAHGDVAASVDCTMRRMCETLRTGQY